MGDVMPNSHAPGGASDLSAAVASPIAARLLRDVRTAQTALAAHAGAGGATRDGLEALAALLTAGVAGLSDEQVLAAPAPEEWSMAEVLDHVAEHDRELDEYQRLGIDHYIEHGLEHALQLWRLRTLGTGSPGGDGVAPAGSD